MREADLTPAARREHRAFSSFLAALGGIVFLAWDVARYGLRRPWPWRALLQQLDEVGVRSLSIVNLTVVFTGMVMALQMGYFLGRFGAKIFISRIVGVTILRELGPVLTAIMIGGRVGAGITAELGSMAVTEQVDALRALGSSPVQKLVVPRVAALLIMLPLLTVVANLTGILGALVISVVELGVSADFYFNSLLQQLIFDDVFSGLAKSVFFAYAIGLIACYNGLTTTGGADGVGKATTATVVQASITVLVSDFFLTKLFLLL